MKCDIGLGVGKRSPKIINRNSPNTNTREGDTVRDFCNTSLPTLLHGQTSELFLKILHQKIY